jgi:hypothetical protein
MKTGKLTWDFPADVGGYSWTPPPPEDRCDALRLVTGLVACNGNAPERSFHAICGNFRLISHHLFLRRSANVLIHTFERRAQLGRGGVYDVDDGLRIDRCLRRRFGS